MINFEKNRREMNNRKQYSPIGSIWDDFEREHFTQEEISEMNEKVSKICELIDARNEGKMNQEEFEAILKEKGVM